MKRAVLLLAIIALTACNRQPGNNPGYTISPVGLKQVELKDRFWLPRIRKMQQSNIRYAFHKCDEEGRFANFVAAGKAMKGQPGEIRGAMPFDDTDVYKTIEGASYSLVGLPNNALEAYIDSVISIIKTGQEPDGYLATWRTVNPMRPPASWVKPGARWFDLGSSHELYNSGHLFEAAAAHYEATGKKNLLDIALKNANLLVEVFGKEDNYDVPGHQIVETGLIRLYHITGKKEYLSLAKKFLDLRGDAAHRTLWGAYNQDHLPVLQQYEAVGHAVRAVYMYAGMTDIAAIYNDAGYKKAVDNLWNNITEKKMYVTGGLGARHDGEAFGDNYELPNLAAYSETCAAIGSVYWNERLFRLSGSAKYYDVIERTLYNALLSGISLEGTEFFYPNPLESDAQFAFNKGSCTRSPWFDCSCCPTNLMRFIPCVPNLVYASDDAGNLYVNLFISSEASVTAGGNNIRISQESDYPWSGTIRLTVKSDKPDPFTLKLRIPGWAQNEVTPGGLYSYADNREASFGISVDGRKVAGELCNGYATIRRSWDKGAEVEITLPMQVRQVVARKEAADLGNLTCLERGPLVYCAEEKDNAACFDQIAISPGDNYKVEYRPETLGGVNVITSAASPGATFIPYYTWSNRGVNKMKVWFGAKSSDKQPVD
jgi:DUF1680 family protein